MNTSNESTEIYSAGDYRRLSDRIRKNPQSISIEDLKMLQALRVTYKEPLAIIFKTIEKMAYKIDKNSICTYRVKRIESIVSKLIRFPKMQVQRMEDIAGCRCIMSDKENVFKLFETIQKNISTLPFEIKGKIQNYIEEPKQSGYQSIHINFALNDNESKRIELQIRCLDQHNWATLVEITDLLYQAKLKEYGNRDSPDLFEFHYLLSKEHQSLSSSEKNRIVDIAEKYHYVERISTVFHKNYIEVRNTWNRMRLRKQSFFLISTDSSGVPDFEGYSNFEKAEAAYFDLFNNNDDNRNIVLTHLTNPSFEKISIAYSNYVLTYNNTLIRILQYLTDSITGAYNGYQIGKFRKYYNCFYNIIDSWLDNKVLELETLGHDVDVKKSIKKKTEWVSSLMININYVKSIYSNVHKSIRFKLFHLVPYLFKIQTDKAFRKRIQAKYMKSSG